MKHFLFIALLAPCSLPAQSTPKADPIAKDDCRPHLNLGFSSMHLQQGNVHLDRDNPSTMTIRNEGRLVVNPRDKVLPRKHEDYILADSITLSHDDKEQLHADHMDYDMTQMKATLRGNVAMSANGVDKKLGSYAVVDLSDNRCRIEKLR